ncbi:MAG: hypothetical protein WC488_04600 [Candidatus Micrarchaeia archaeon]
MEGKLSAVVAVIEGEGFELVRVRVHDGSCTMQFKANCVVGATQ